MSHCKVLWRSIMQTGHSMRGCARGNFKERSAGSLCTGLQRTAPSVLKKPFIAHSQIYRQHCSERPFSDNLCCSDVSSV